MLILSYFRIKGLEEYKIYSGAKQTQETISPNLGECQFAYNTWKRSAKKEVNSTDISYPQYT